MKIVFFTPVTTTIYLVHSTGYKMHQPAGLARTARESDGRTKVAVWLAAYDDSCRSYHGNFLSEAIP